MGQKMFFDVEEWLARVVALLYQVNEIVDRFGGIVFEKFDDKVSFGSLDANLRIVSWPVFFMQYLVS